MSDQDGYCPQCGQPLPTGFATGTRSLSLDPGVRYADDVPDPEGQTGYEVIMRLGDGQDVDYIAENMSLTRDQVVGLIPFVKGTPNVRAGIDQRLKAEMDVEAVRHPVARRHRTVEVEP
jgi:hypothetical protein